jgi:hypothetical protein
VVGFSPDTLTGVERGERYTVQAGFLSGRPERGGNVNLKLLPGTAGNVNSLIHTIAKKLHLYMYVGVNDITASPQIRLLRVIPLSAISFTYRLDGVAQESNETFSIEYELNANNRDFFPDDSVFSDITIGHLNGTIIDIDSE